MAALSIVPTSGSGFPSLPATPPDPTTPPAALTLYNIEEQLAALTECLDIVPAEQEAELVARIGEALTQAVDKRDSMGRFLAHVEAQIEFASAEITRLQERKMLFARVLEQTEAYILRVLVGIGKDAQGKWPKLEGRTVTFGVKKLPPSVAIDDDAAVPSAYRRATVKLATPLWEQILDALDVELAGRLMDEAKRTDEVSKTAIAAALKAGVEVPGAHLSQDGVKLVRA